MDTLLTPKKGTHRSYKFIFLREVCSRVSAWLDTTGK